MGFRVIRITRVVRAIRIIRVIRVGLVCFLCTGESEWYRKSQTGSLIVKVRLTVKVIIQSSQTGSKRDFTLS